MRFEIFDIVCFRINHDEIGGATDLLSSVICNEDRLSIFYINIILNIIKLCREKSILNF